MHVKMLNLATSILVEFFENIRHYLFVFVSVKLDRELKSFLYRNLFYIEFDCSASAISVLWFGVFDRADGMVNRRRRLN